MRTLLTILTVATFCASPASATSTPRTAAQWATLCAHAERPETLGTIPLLRTQNRALAASLKAAGYPTSWHQDLATVLINHGDNTCGYDNRIALQLSPKDPESDLNGNSIIDIDDPFPDGAWFTDPASKVPEGYVWSAKFASAGARLYLPPIAETREKIAADRDRFIAMTETLCTESGRAWNATTRECTGKTITAQTAVKAMPEHEPTVTGTVHTAFSITQLVFALAGWLLFLVMSWLWMTSDRDHKERDSALLRLSASEALCVDLTQQRDQARETIQTLAVKYKLQLQEQVVTHDQAMDRVRAQALADETEFENEIGRLRTAARANIQEHRDAMAQVATERDEAKATIAALNTELEDYRTAQAQTDKLLATTESRIQELEETATTLRRLRAEAKVDTERTLQIARDQQQALLIISRGGNSQLDRITRVLPTLESGLHGVDYFLRVKCPRPGKGDRAGKTPRDKAHAQLTDMATTLRALFRASPENGRHAVVSAQAPATV